MNGSQASARRKYIYPAATRRKMALAKLGRKLSDTHKRNISRGVRAALRKAVRRG